MPPRAEPPCDHAPAESPSSPSPSFEDGLAQLAELVNRLEGGGLGLTESIAAYERGVTILRGLHDELSRAEERIRLLTAVDDEGRPTTAPFGDAAPDAAPKADAEKVGRRPASRSAAPRRTAAPPTLPGMDEAGGDA
ncbi:MAG: exodeoxyribonuclease VII small subunit [Planctomycetia bacterium]|nr:exodeoxyribonuclease VII small subunit [Planctomycetia bacterium]